MLTLLIFCLQDVTSYWVGYPILREPISLRHNLLLKRRDELDQFSYEVVRVRTIMKSSGRQAWHDVKDLAVKLLKWQAELPECFQCHTQKALPFAVLELQ